MKCQTGRSGRSITGLKKKKESIIGQGYTHGATDDHRVRPGPSKGDDDNRRRRRVRSNRASIIRSDRPLGVRPVSDYERGEGGDTDRLTDGT